eukprot:4740116-Amphidinium_carterae.1
MTSEYFDMELLCRMVDECGIKEEAWFMRLFDNQQLPPLHCRTRGRGRWQLNGPCYDPQTNGDCLFMCISYELNRLGVCASPSLLRQRVHKIWQDGWTYLEADAQLWSIAAGKPYEEFMRTTTTTTRWGMAADAIALARSFRLNVNIYGKSGALLVRDRTIEGGSTMRLRLANQHYTVMEERHTSIDCEDCDSFYLFREAAGKTCLRELTSLRRYLASKGVVTCSHAPAQKAREDPQGHPSGTEKGREASKREDPTGHLKDPRWTPFGGRVGFFGSFLGPFACLGVVEIISVLCRAILLPGRAHLQDSPGLAWIGGKSCYPSSCCCCPSAVLNTFSVQMIYQGGMPTKVVPVQQQPEPLSEDERFEFQGLWIALKRVNMRVHWSLDSPIDASLPPGAMARVIGPTRLVAPSKARHQNLPKAKNIVRAYVELAAPWRRGNCGDFGYITLRVLQPEGPTYFRPASSKDR